MSKREKAIQWLLQDVTRLNMSTRELVVEGKKYNITYRSNKTWATLQKEAKKRYK